MSRYLPKRVVLYPKDVERITGRGEKTARKLLNEIRRQLGKSPKDFISVGEFCAHTGLPEVEVYAAIA